LLAGNPKSIPALPVKHPEDTMRKFLFTVTLIGEGDNAQEAFHNAVKNFQDINRIFWQTQETELLPDLNEVIAELERNGETTIFTEMLTDLLEQEYCKTRHFTATLFANQENDARVKEVKPGLGDTPGLVSIIIGNKRLGGHS
jgi:hypothetical protein